MNTVSRTISGSVSFALGVFVIFVTITDETDVWAIFWGVVWGVFLCGVGGYLFWNKKEDEIEEIKNNKE